MLSFLSAAQGAGGASPAVKAISLSPRSRAAPADFHASVALPLGALDRSGRFL
jgi:hypothetical protein